MPKQPESQPVQSTDQVSTELAIAWEMTKFTALEVQPGEGQTFADVVREEFAKNADTVRKSRIGS